jgi:hypothetical protein
MHFQFFFENMCKFVLTFQTCYFAGLHVVWNYIAVLKERDKQTNKQTSKEKLSIDHKKAKNTLTSFSI